MCEAAPKGKNVEGGLDYWLAQAEMLLSGLLFVAHHTGRDMGTVCQWVLTQDRPGGEWGTGEVKAALDVLMEEAAPSVQDDAQDAGRALGRSRTSPALSIPLTSGRHACERVKQLVKRTTTDGPGRRRTGGR